MLGRIVSGALGGMLPEIRRLLVRVQNGEFQDCLAKIAKHADGWEMSIPAVCETVILVMLGVLAVWLPMPSRRRRYERHL